MEIEKVSKAIPPPLSETQRELMEIIWKHGELSVNEVRDAIGPKRQLARNTVPDDAGTA